MFVFTTNVDSHWTRVSGLDASTQLYEVHGSTQHKQCAAPRTFKCRATRLDWETLACPHCAGSTRPHVFMFMDAGFADEALAPFKQRYDEFVKRHQIQKLLLLVIGVGDEVDTVRTELHWLKRTRWPNAPTICVRINPVASITHESWDLQAAYGARDALVAAARTM